MALKTPSRFGWQLLQHATSRFLVPITACTNPQIVRHRHTKHWLPKWKLLRKVKVVKVKLPDFKEEDGNLTEEEIRSKLKEVGLQPPRPWVERQFFVSTTGSVFEPYIPPEGDGKVSAITAQGAKQKLQYLEKKSKTMMAIRKIRSYEEEFDTPEFCKLAEDIYIKTHECLVKGDKETILDYVTEKAYPEIIHNIENKTLHWKFIKNIELPRVVHARCTNLVTDENYFAQITVRFHMQQQLAIYDRFGRLMHGSEIIAKDVLEYVVFEKHIANEYGKWRIHAKIIPDWAPPREPAAKTSKFTKQPEPEETVDSTQIKTDTISTASKETSVNV